MREFIFRGWSSYHKRWVYGALVTAGDFCCILEEDDGTNYDYPYLDNDLGIIDGNITPVDPKTVGQWTGRVDKNGKKIFDGDIVRAVMDYGPAGSEINIVCISWHDKLGYQWEYFDMNTIEVIGNKWDNPKMIM